MQKKLPIALAAVIVGAVAYLFLPGGPGEDSRQVAPAAGRECFEHHRTAMPPGSQYEGFEVDGDDLVVKVMTGVETREVRCRLTPAGGIDLERTATAE